MALPRQTDTSGRDHYAAIYRDELAAEARWLQYGAADKVDSVAQLLAGQGIVPGRVLELGCGTGAVITECQRRGLGQSFTAIDYSADAIAHLAAQSPGIECFQADINAPDFRLDREFDVVILSHVLEHLEEPERLLASLRERIRFKYLVAEVPLEDLFFSRVKAQLRDRMRNTAGHVQFYTPQSFAQLLQSARFRIVAERNYAPVLSLEAAEFVSRKDGLSAPRTALKKLLNCHLPRLAGPVWRRYYYANQAMLCVPD